VNRPSVGTQVVWSVRENQKQMVEPAQNWQIPSERQKFSPAKKASRYKVKFLELIACPPHVCFIFCISVILFAHKLLSPCPFSSIALQSTKSNHTSKFKLAIRCSKSSRIMQAPLADDQMRPPRAAELCPEGTYHGQMKRLDHIPNYDIIGKL
jgi:hypothetical protein